MLTCAKNYRSSARRTGGSTASTERRVKFISKLDPYSLCTTIVNLRVGHMPKRTVDLVRRGNLEFDRNREERFPKMFWGFTTFLIVTAFIVGGVPAANAESPDGKILSAKTEPDLLVSGQTITNVATVKNTGTINTYYELEIYRLESTGQLLLHKKEFALSAGETRTFSFSGTMGDPGPRTYTYKLYWDKSWPDTDILLDTAIEERRCYSTEEVSDYDNDNLLYYIEVEQMGTDPNNPDTDSDGKLDGVDNNPKIPEGIISISTSPSGAAIYLNGVYVGTTPLTLEDIVSASYNVKIVKEGYDEETKAVSLGPGGTMNLDIQLKQSLGSIIVSSNPSGANVYLDGNFKGVTPITLTDMSIVSHTVKLTKSDYDDITKTVSVSAGETTHVNEALKKITTPTPTTPTPTVQTLTPATPKPATPTPTLTHSTFGSVPPSYIIGAAVLVIMLIAGIGVSRRGKGGTGTSTKPKPPTEPPKLKKETSKDKSAGQSLTKPEEGLIITSAFGYKGATIIQKIKVENPTPEPVSDIKIHLFVPEVFMIKDSEKQIGLLKSGESKTITFEIRPTGECGDCEVSGRVVYYDYSSKNTKEVIIPPKTLSIVCPVLKIKKIDEETWRLVVSELTKTEETTKEMQIPAKTLFEVTTDILKDMNMFMLPPSISETPQLYRATARFYAEGVKELKYAAQIEVVGGTKNSKLILKAWAEKEEALTGFYHGILDEIEKRVQVKGYIDDRIVQQVYHIGTVVRDSVVQRSTISAGAGKKCPKCGREVSEDERFCPYCEEQLK